MIELNKIYNADCLEKMKDIPDGSVDMCITSPPYNAGIDYGNSYDDKKTLEEYLSFVKKVFIGVYRCLKNGGRLAINVANTGRKPYIPMASYYNVIMGEIGFLCRGEIIWNKGASVGTSCAWGSWRSPSNPSIRDIHEYILVFSKGEYKHEKASGYGTIYADEFTEYTKSIWMMQTESAKRIGHPAPYPIELPKRLIRLYTFTDDIVLDPFMGSGTTCVAAIREKRHYIGIELNEEYFDIAKKRIENELNQPTLF